MSKDEQSRMEAALHWRAVMTDGAATPAERQAFGDWLNAAPENREAFARAEQFWSELGTLPAGALDAAFFRPSLRERARSAGFAVLGALQDMAWRPAAGFALAACAALVVFLAIAPDQAGEEQPVVAAHATKAGEIREIALADGSLVTLGGGSAIETAFTASARTIILRTGEAYFDVAPDAERPFDVVAGELRASALGTEFDVQLKGPVTRVSVAEGVVGVAWPSSPAARLLAGRQIAATRAGGLDAPSAIDPEQVGAWRDHRLVYLDAALSEVIADANRYAERPVRLTDPAIGDLRVSATFDSRDIDSMLAALTEIFALRVDDSAGGVELRAAP